MIVTGRCGMIVLLAVVFALTATVNGEAIKTEVVGSPGQWQFVRDGKPYFIRGTGGGGSMQLLKDLGGNSVRTWGADDLGEQLDQAHALGLSVCVGIWLGQENRINHFNYDDPAQVAKQFETAKAAIRRYKDHPAVLVWGIGNEMEGPIGTKASIWRAVNDIAAFAKQVDPNHPTMTVIAEIGENAAKIKAVQEYCPAVDIIGVNSYGGAFTLAERYKASGVSKPYVVTEFGPIGPWEGGHTAYGAPIEPTSTEKAAMYERAYVNAVNAAPGTGLGGYAFLWGWKQETTATWFGLMLEDGMLTPAVNALASAWGGKTVPMPTVSAVKIDGSDTGQPGGTIRASVRATGHTKIEWQLHRETEAPGLGGSFEPKTRQYPEAIKADGDSVLVTLPRERGVYRLYAFARDDAKHAATANVPLRVVAKSATAATGLKQPVVIYGDDAPASGYVPSGWMGNTAAIRMNPASTVQPHAGATAFQCQYTAAGDFGGVVWQSPANNWGAEPGGRDLQGAKRLRFWARGERGGESVDFKFGILDGDEKHKDSDGGKTSVTLEKVWKQYSIDLVGKDLSQILTAFCWVTRGQGSTVTFYLDDIAFE